MPEHAYSGRDLALTVLTWALVSILAALLVWLACDLVRMAWPRLGWDLLTQPLQRAGRAGGIAGILASTGLVLAVCWAVAAPLGLGAAWALARSRARWTTAVRTSLDILAGLPSILLGLFGLLVFGDALGLGFSIASGGLTLACMILPTVVRVADAAFRAVPAHLLANAAALGLSESTTLLRLVLPAAAPGLLAAVALGTGRALAETAALVFTAGASDRMPSALTDPGRTLAVHIYELAMNVAGGNASAAASAVVLVAALACIQAGSALLFSRLRTGTP
jgi:phosphate transport system permease protein